MNNGKIDKAEIQSVDFIRFRKCLSTTHQRSSSITDLNQANIEDERTLLVMNVNAIENILPHMKLQKPDIYSLSGPVWPWEVAARRFRES